MSSSPLPKRSRKYGIGKEIAGKVYIHAQYEHVLGNVVTQAKQHLLDDFDYDVVKYDQRNQSVSFIQSSDFDTADEPTVGDSIVVRRDGTTRSIHSQSDPMIFHHKWLFVGDDYAGFDVAQSQERSRKWCALSGIDRSRIGRQSYWVRHVLPKLKSGD